VLRVCGRLLLDDDQTVCAPVSLVDTMVATFPSMLGLFGAKAEKVHIRRWGQSMTRLRPRSCSLTAIRPYSPCSMRVRVYEKTMRVSTTVRRQKDAEVQRERVEQSLAYAGSGHSYLFTMVSLVLYR
jgi:hypothetical protein